MPVYWSNYSGPLPYAAVGAAATRAAAGTAADGQQPMSVWEAIALPQPLPYGPTQMPPMPMTDEERAALVRYLARLGR